MDINIQEMIFQFLGGLGLFLFAIKFMGDGLQKAAGDRLRDILDKFTTNPLMGVLVGIIVTVLIQSSSGTTVITVGLVSAGLMKLRQAIGVIMGANIGTTITAILAALGASIAAKRAAATHLLFNVVGTIIFMLILGLFTNYVEWIAGLLNLEPKMQIAFAHGTFNVINTLVQLPFIGVWAYVVTKLIPGEDSVIEYKPKFLDKNLIVKSPSI
ncbi:MAG TPA: sodium-dependent phosphate transporter, partial [Lysinibacillus sp.]|nr:sodium-dependent phosphate transporter [Lysinibacillus sp.]